LFRINFEDTESDFLSRSPEAKKADEFRLAVMQLVEFLLFAKGAGSPFGKFSCDDTPDACNCFRVKSIGVKCGEPLEIVVTEGHEPRMEHTFKFELSRVGHSAVPAGREAIAVGYCSRCQKGYRIFESSSECAKCNGRYGNNNCQDCHKCA